MLSLPLCPPGGTVLKNPVEQSFFKTDVMAGLLALQPFVSEDLFALGNKLLIKERFLDEIRAIVRGGSHDDAGKFHTLESSVNASAANDFALMNLEHLFG